MYFENFLLEVKDGIAIFTVNRPTVRNALNANCWTELSRFVDELNTNDQIKLAVITGSGDKAFVSGADVKFLKERTMVTALDGLAQGVLRKLDGCVKPIIAAVNGVAFGGGCELAMVCDIRICSENARFALPELGLGILPGGGGTQRLAKLVGLGRAKEMILTGRAITAQEAFQIGLTTAVVPSSSLLDEVLRTAAEILKKGPLAVRLTKRLVSMSMSTDEEAGMMMELLSFGLLVASEDRTEGVNAFLEKRPPTFHGC